MSKPTDKLQTIAEFLGEKRVDDLKDYVLAELKSDFSATIKEYYVVTLLKEVIKNCKKLRSQGNGCFDCRYSSDCFAYDCRIGEPYTWELDEKEPEIHEEVDE